jgi:ABC-type transporter lipoprotein component MlaA
MKTILIIIIAALSTGLGQAARASEQHLQLPEIAPDPLERVNRAVWSANKVFNNNVARPVGHIYRFVARKPVRGGINNFAKNLTYPSRLLNNLFTGKWSGARDETYRFLANSTAGVGGLFNVADRWKIPKSEADFGKTFAHYGYRPGPYLVLPIFGPSNVRDGVGLIGEAAAHPLTYFPPYLFATYGFKFNRVSDQIEDFRRFTDAQVDSYETVKQAATYLRKNRVVDFEVSGEQDPASLETLQIVFLGHQDSQFPDRRRTRSVSIPGSDRNLKYSYWLQPETAPVVYILPGLGAHRLANPAIALAETAYRQGYSAIVISSVFNCEFAGSASTFGVVGHTPSDTRDVHRALTEIDHSLRHRHPGRLGRNALMGYSMGGFHTLTIAASPAEKSLIQFDRHLAINPPVDLHYGARQLDDYFNAPLEWPEAERTQRIENTFLKATSLFQQKELSASVTLSGQNLPFDSVESRFLIGYVFRNSLRDYIFDVEYAKRLGIIKAPISKYRRSAAYREIMNHSFENYFEDFAAPFHQQHGTATDLAALRAVNTLRAHESALRNNRSIRVVMNQNDFLLSEADQNWLRTTLGADRVTVFNQGGHLGNLGSDNVQHAIRTGLAGLAEMK